MNLFNVEIFDSRMNYKSSFPVEKVKVNNDYLSIEGSTLQMQSIEASKGDYIIVRGQNETYCGIVDACSDKTNYKELTYKPFLNLTNVSVHYDKDRLNSISLEQWIAEILDETYCTNPDPLQNIKKFYISYIPHTMNAILNLESNIGKLYSILTTALVSYGVVVSFALDVEAMAVVVKVSANTDDAIVIEADLPNILDKNFTFKKTEDSVNKITVFSSDETLSETFYLLEDGTVSQDAESGSRIEPVIFTNSYINNNDAEKFHDAAYAEAFNKLVPVKYDNLIELTVKGDDELVTPGDIQIGQSVNILRDGKVYQSILTGKQTDGEKIKLLFGAVRLELTKILNRRNLK